MGARRDLLSFLVGLAEPEAAAKFHRVLADDGLQRLGERLNKAVEKQKNPNWFQKFGQQMFPPEKTILDLEPEELDRITRVERMQENRTEFELPIDVALFKATLFEAVPDDARINNLINRFYSEHRNDFDSPKDMAYNKEKKVILFRGPIEVAEKLLKALNVLEDVAESLIKGEGIPKKYGIIEPEELEIKGKLRVPLERLTEGEDVETFKQNVRAFLEEQEEDLRPRIGVEADRMLLMFEGTKAQWKIFLDALLPEQVKKREVLMKSFKDFKVA